jgi:cardiolipin synthase A/B
MSLPVLVSLGLLGLLVLTLAAIGLLQVTRGTPVSRVVHTGDRDDAVAASDATFAQTVSLIVHTRLLPDNDVEVLANGDETYPRLWADLEGARRSISLQLYYCRPGRMADQLQQVLTERARAGVEVRFLYDAFGGQDLPQKYFAPMRQAGVTIAAFRPLRPSSLQKAQHRSHVRVVVVDGRVGYTGGFGVDDKWFGDGRTKGQWRDTNARCEGPAALQFQAAFGAAWAEATGELLIGDRLYPPELLEALGPPARGDSAGASDACLTGLLYATPAIGSTTAERLLTASIAAARRTLHITNSYFAPDDDVRRLLTDAARRGVDVRILTPAPEQTDVKTMYYAGRARYEELLAGGVRLYEYQPTMIHAKTVVADGVWSSVGTMNLDNRALALNDESTLIVRSEAIAARLEALFADDLRHAHEITLETFRKRPWTSKLLENAAHVTSRMI